MFHACIRKLNMMGNLGDRQRKKFTCHGTVSESQRSTDPMAGSETVETAEANKATISRNPPAAAGLGESCRLGPTRTPRLATATLSCLLRLPPQISPPADMLPSSSAARGRGLGRPLLLCLAIALASLLAPASASESDHKVRARLPHVAPDPSLRPVLG